MCNAVNALFADQIEEMKLIVANKDSLIADQSALIEKLKAQLEQYSKKES